MQKRNSILLGSDNNAVIYLLGINLVVYLFFLLMFMIFANAESTQAQYYNNLISQFALPNASFWEKPWTLLTYFFSQNTFLGLLSNMLWLFSFAYLLQNVAGNKYIFPSYIYGGLAGGIAYIIITLIMPGKLPPVLSPSNAILALSATTVAIVPNYRIFPMINGGIPLWLLFSLFMLINMVSAAYMSPLTIPIQLVAIGTGYLYGKSVQDGKDWGSWMHWIYNQFLGKASRSNQPKTKQYYNTGRVVPISKTMHVNQLTVDEILDKINHKGIGSLTKEEKATLQKAKDLL